MRQREQNVKLLSAANGKLGQKCSTPWHPNFLTRFHSLGVLEAGEADPDQQFISLFSEMFQSPPCQHLQPTCTCTFAGLPVQVVAGVSSFGFYESWVFYY